MNRTIPLVVYGTLKSGHVNNRHYLGDREPDAVVTTPDHTLVDLIYGFPGMIPADGEHVAGELFFVSADELQAIDGLEGFYQCSHDGSMYLRRWLRVDGAEGTDFAWGYVWNRGFDEAWGTGPSWPFATEEENI